MKKQRGAKRNSRIEVLVCAGLVAAIFAIYAPVAGFEFVNFDDDLYVYANSRVASGLTWDGLKWAFTSVDYFYWQPLTWLSHMLDCELFGLKPGAHHIINVVLHSVNAVLVFLALRSATGALGRSAAVAGIFAFHPTRVESVAWVAERKELLSGLFWILALLAYVHYVHRPSRRRYLLVFAAMLGGVMSKPTIVTLPFVLLLLDWWPLGRTDRFQQRVIEKAPLFLLSMISSIVTYVGQEQMGAMRLMGELPFSVRLVNAIVSYGWYLWTFMWPHDLTVLYPYHKEFAPATISGACSTLIAVSGVAIWRARRQPYLVVGWLWFLGVLVPVIGIIQAGSQARADRFTYIPLIGLAMAVVWYTTEALTGWKAGVRVSLAILTALSLAIASRAQTAYWRNGVTLFSRAVEVTRENPIAHHNLGFALAGHGRSAEAVPHFREALRMNPAHAEGHYNLGRALWTLGRDDEARSSFAEAIARKPAYAEAHFALATLAVKQGDGRVAMPHFHLALQHGLMPEYAAEAHNDLGVLLAQGGDFKAAEDHFRAAVALKPDFVKARQNLASAIAAQGGTAR